METITTSIVQFGLDQKKALERGKLHRNRLKGLVKNISTVKDGDKYPHTYIFSPPGLGKTFTVRKHLEKSNIRYIQVSGNVSMFAFGIQLAIINYFNDLHETVIVFVDDCDEILKNEVNCNTMKNVLEGDKKFIYEKSLASQWNNLSEIQKEAIEHFEEKGKMGFTVPTDNLVFVFTSNFKLPVDDEVRIAREKNQSKATLLAHKNAIRSRCRVADFDLSGHDQWGWIADVVLNTNCLDYYEIEDYEKQIILDFLWLNWNHLTERSIRLVEKMSVTLKEYPTNYKEIWEIDYLKN